MNVVFDSRFSLTDESGSWPLRYFEGDPQEFRRHAYGASIVRFDVDRTKDLVSALVALDGWAREVLLQKEDDAVMRSEVDRQELNSDLAMTEPEQLISIPLVTRWIIYTSGTTSKPNKVSHTLASLTKTVKKGESIQTLKWGLLYEPTKMAGLQVVLQAMVAGSELVCPSSDADFLEKLRFLRRHSVTALSGTPSMWRRILQSGLSNGWNLDQITLGGEIADQKLLDGLSDAWPKARIRHIYASTETGVVFSVQDRQEGFPVFFLNEQHEGPKLRIIDGILEVYIPNSDFADTDGFVSTGDVVEISGERALFRGRASGSINIAGAMVLPEDVERLIRSHPDVQEALVSPRRNAFSGTVLVAQIVVRENSTLTEGELRSWIKARAPRHFVPASIRFVDLIGLTNAGKATRV